MKIYYLGTCSGTEPMKGTHQTSFVIEIDGALYWFDAGEGCAHTAVTVAGLDITKTEALFISHPHIDHTGGSGDTKPRLPIKTAWRCTLRMPHSWRRQRH